jgi:hypothetical protein
VFFISSCGLCSSRKPGSYKPVHLSDSNLHLPSTVSLVKFSPYPNQSLDMCGPKTSQDALKPNLFQRRSHPDILSAFCSMIDAWHTNHSRPRQVCVDIRPGLKAMFGPRTNSIPRYSMPLRHRSHFEHALAGNMVCCQ